MVIKQRHSLALYDAQCRIVSFANDYQQHIEEFKWLSQEVVSVVGQHFAGTITISANEIALEFELRTAIAKMFKAMIESKVKKALADAVV